jgi:hypothetical protein
MIDLFLWICPLAGAGALLGNVLARRAELPWPGYGGTQFFGLPSSTMLALAAGAVVAPLVIACATRRAMGFLAGVSLVLLVSFAAAWVRSHLAADGIALHSFEELADGPWESQWSLVSQGGGTVLVHYRWRIPQARARSRQGWRWIGWDGCIEFQAGAATPGYPLSRGVGAATQPLTRRLGFALGTRTRWYGGSLPAGILVPLALPYWFLCLIAAPLPLAWTIRHRRRRRVVRRALAGQCVGCGYDLRATPDPTGARLAVCPECGEETQGKARSH